MSVLLDKFDAYRRLGFDSLVRGLVYRIGIKSGFNPARRIQARIPPGDFFGESISQCDALPSMKWTDSDHCFGWFTQFRDSTFPDWFRDPIHNKKIPDPHKPWWMIPDFSKNGCDIKCIWEASRMDWALAMAQRASAVNPAINSSQTYTGKTEIARLNRWLRDWCEKNPPYQGPNWKCGQEASIRVLHLAMTSIVLYGAAKSDPNWVFHTKPALLALIQAHLKRIEATTGYAIAQNNNHGLSEAAALFVGGTWLSSIHALKNESRGQSPNVSWEQAGRHLIEDRVETLFARDGSFSQYSVNYHRLALDTLSMVEVWRRDLGLPSFSAHFYEKAVAATIWLFEFTDPATGDAPNLGNNDGARLLPLTDSDYRDFRPSLQLAANLFLNARSYREPGPWDLPARWLGLDEKLDVLSQKQSQVFVDGGYAILKQENISGYSQQKSRQATVFFRIPNFRFRPAHADALHVDFWVNGVNLIRDSGSYAYNTNTSMMRYFAGTESHSTVQFDARDQMPSVSRFLFGRWIKMVGQTEITATSNGSQVLSSSYRDWKGARHHRCVSLSSQLLVVEDKIANFKKSATVRWRLLPADWKLDGMSAHCDNMSICVTSDVAPRRCEMNQKWESRYYWQKVTVPVFEIEFDSPTTIRTEIAWHI